MRRWVLILLTLAVALALGGCLRSVAVNPEDAVAASEHFGNIRIEDEQGVFYYAQSLEEGEEGFYTLNMVKIVDDGVADYVNEHHLAEDKIVAIHYYENNRWVVAGLTTATVLFLIYLYYSINTSIFD